MDKVVLFGAGKRCKDFIVKMSGKFKIEYIVDNDIAKAGTTQEGIEIKCADILRQETDKTIVITPYDCGEIIDQLSEMQADHLFVYGRDEKIRKVTYAEKNKKRLQEREISVGEFLKRASGEGGEITLDNVCFKSGGSGVLDYAFLKGIMQYFRLKTYLEIGTYIGESISNVSAIADKCFSITVPPDHPASMRQFCLRYDMVDFSNRLLDQDNVIQYLADSKDFDFHVIEDKVDLYFIDGDHSMEGIENDTRKVMGHRDRNSFVVWHDVKKEGHQINEVTIEAIYNVLGSEGLKNFYLCDNCKCGVYVPDPYTDVFDSMCGYERNRLYSYTLAIKVRQV